MKKNLLQIKFFFENKLSLPEKRPQLTSFREAIKYIVFILIYITKIFGSIKTLFKVELID